MPFPSLAEQEQIARAVAHSIQHMDALSDATKNTITLLEERRTALIAAAVYGTTVATNSLPKKDIVHAS